MQFIDLSTQLKQMRAKIDQRIASVLDHGQFIMGPEVFELEEQLANYVGVEHCITCANGTDALQIALMARGIGNGDIVFTTAFSFFATAEVIALVGATPYFVDIDPVTFNLSAEHLKKAIDEVNATHPGKAKAVIAVDLFGLPADYVQIEALCEANQLLLVEDAAQGFGGMHNSKRAGSFGDVATTSFFPAKPLGCYGDGGALFTDCEEIAKIARSIRIHGKGQHKYENVRIGLNSRLDTIQAAILLQKLASFPQELAHRQKIAMCYGSLGACVDIPVVPENYLSCWAQYTIKVAPSEREGLQRHLDAHGIPSTIYYPKALNEQLALHSALGQETPIAKKATESVLSLPMSGWLPMSDAEKVTRVVKAFYGQ